METPEGLYVEPVFSYVFKTRKTYLLKIRALLTGVPLLLGKEMSHMETDRLRAGAEVFRGLLGKDYILVLDNGIELRIVFERDQFYHLAGLHKLKDISEVKLGKGNSARTVYKKILSGKISDKRLRKSRSYEKVKERISGLVELEDLIQAQVIIDFDSALVPGTSLVEADYILFKRLGDGSYWNLALKSEMNRSVPISFFYEPSKMYITGQNLLNVVKVRIEERKRVD